ncbi:MAG: hypothetical protein EPO07_14675, partial [Verrucomicrobia bacterium]
MRTRKNLSQHFVIISTRTFLVAGVLFFGAESFAKPRVPQPPWPEATIRIFGFDSPYWTVPWSAATFNEGNATLVESWNGYALLRDEKSTVEPVTVPFYGPDGKQNFAGERGAIRFWFSPQWSGSDQGGEGPGCFARLLELVDWSGNEPRTRWSLCTSEDGTTLFFLGPTKSGDAVLLKSPVTFNAGQWRLVTLCYSPTNTALFVDGELTSSGEGLLPPEEWQVKGLGLVVGSDLLASPESVAGGQFEELTTFTRWPKPADQALYHFGVGHVALFGPVGTREEELEKQDKFGLVAAEADAQEAQEIGTRGMLRERLGHQRRDLSYPSNTLWLEITGVSNGVASLIVHGSSADTVYEILSKENATNTTWNSEGTIFGAADQDWTPKTVTVGMHTNSLFLWARSWIDSDGNGLSDWWQLQYFGHLGVDPEQDFDNDGRSNMQEFLGGTDPTRFDMPDGPENFLAVLTTNGTNVTLFWDQSPGSVLHYALGRYTFNWTTFDWDYYSLGQVSSNSISFLDVGAVSNGNQFEIYYGIQAAYTNGLTPMATAGIWESAPSPDGLIVSFNPNTGTANLNWQRSTGPVTSYTVLRKDSAASSFTAIATVAATQTSYVDAAVPTGDGVEYEVVAN